jgi:hypothetical protein
MGIFISDISFVRTIETGLILFDELQLELAVSRIAGIVACRIVFLVAELRIVIKTHILWDSNNPKKRKFSC